MQHAIMESSFDLQDRAYFIMSLLRYTPYLETSPAKVLVHQAKDFILAICWRFYQLFLYRGFRSGDTNGFPLFCIRPS